MPGTETNYTVPVLVGGLAGAVLSVVPPCCCLCCLNYAVAGVIAGAMFARTAGFPPIERGALVGAIAGAIAGVGNEILGLGVKAVTGPWMEDWKEMVREYGDAEAFEQFERWGAFEPSGGGWLLVQMLLAVVLGAGLGALGGLLGVLIARREPPEPPASPRYEPPAAPPPFPPFPPAPPPGPGVPPEPPPAPGEDPSRGTGP